MERGRWTVLPVSLAVLGLLAASLSARAGQTADELLQRIQSQQNPVKKAKDEVKLARLKLTEVQDSYSQGHTEEGVKLLGAYVDQMKSSWKFLKDSGRTASKQPDGFRELEIALREDVRSLQDLARTVSYFDRAPLEKAGEELDQMRNDVLNALFPAGSSRNHKGSPAPVTNTNPGSPSEVR